MNKKTKLILEFNKLNATIQTRDEISDLVQTPLYHFTKASIFESIISSRNLLLSSFDTMNDSSEMIYSKRFMSKIINSYPCGYGRDFLYKFDFFLKAINVYVICFCEDRDNDHLWQKYGDNHSGFALGFKSNYGKNKAIDYSKTWPQVVIKVKYGSKELDSDLQEYITIFARLLRTTKNNTEYLEYVDSFVRNFYLSMPRYKGNMWKSEREHRWCMMDRGPRLKILPTMIVGGRAVIENIVKDQLDEIIIGRDCTWSEKNVKDLLDKNGYAKTINIVKR